MCNIIVHTGSGGFGACFAGMLSGGQIFGIQQPDNKKKAFMPD